MNRAAEYKIILMFKYDNIKIRIWLWKTSILEVFFVENGKYSLAWQWFIHSANTSLREQKLWLEFSNTQTALQTVGKW